MKILFYKTTYVPKNVSESCEYLGVIDFYDISTRQWFILCLDVREVHFLYVHIHILSYLLYSYFTFFVRSYSHFLVILKSFFFFWWGAYIGYE